MVGKHQSWCRNRKQKQKPNLLLTQIGDTVGDQIVFLAYSAPGAECDNTICVLKLTTNLVKRQQVSTGNQGPD